MLPEILDLRPPENSKNTLQHELKSSRFQGLQKNVLEIQKLKLILYFYDVCNKILTWKIFYKAISSKHH